ncbi:aldehyde dehydrogenase family protein [Pseudonocardia sp. KRD291]|uniref:aldehyde dehydrogenase family protein n=1 Tax=Pseudonocardia sp. KRD291 TaxID=2792007 RepID=UPI0035B1B2A9
MHGGHRVRPDGLPGAFLSPALVSEVGPDSDVVQEDLFGPVLALLTYPATPRRSGWPTRPPFGLAAAVWSATDWRSLPNSSTSISPADRQRQGISSGDAVHHETPLDSQCSAVTESATAPEWPGESAWNQCGSSCSASPCIWRYSR